MPHENEHFLKGMTSRFSCTLSTSVPPVNSAYKAINSICIVIDCLID